MNQRTISDFIGERDLKGAIYLGDGVYAAHDPIQVWLMVERDDRVESIALDDQTWAALVRYMAERTGGVIITGDGS